MNSAQYWIDRLNLQAHPEGGYFSEVYRSDEKITSSALPDRFTADHAFSTSIYFLLKSGEPSKFHRILADETWHFYAGSPLTIHLLDTANGYRTLPLGSDFDNGYRFQQTVPRNVWFGATVDQPESFTLVGCTVAPGFEFEDFELADRNYLLENFANHSEIIRTLT